jgi:hypothetical protein
MKRIVVLGVLLALVSAATSAQTNAQNLLIGQWETVETTTARGFISDIVEFFDDGTGFMEAENIIGIGPWVESFAWRITSDGRLIMTSPIGIAQIYTIAYISASTLVLEGNLPMIGHVRTVYSRR